MPLNMRQWSTAQGAMTTASPSTNLPLYELARQFSETAHMPAFVFQSSFRALSHQLCMHGRQLGCPPGGVVAFPTFPPHTYCILLQPALAQQLLNFHHVELHFPHPHGLLHLIHTLVHCPDNLVT